MGSARIESTHEGCTEALARGMARIVRPGDSILLRGELGAGKTLFVRSLAMALGADPGVISSPTYVIVNEYPLARDMRLAHVDAYRLHDADELAALGWDQLKDGGTIFAIEWPERIPEGLPRENAATIEFAHAGAHERVITLHVPESWLEREGASRLIERPPIRCRVTGSWVDPLAPTWPFADERARMTDLGRWFGEGYTIGRPANPDELPAG